MSKRHPEGRQLKYIDYCDIFVWNPIAKMWTKRIRDKFIGRIIFIRPTDGEKYYL